MHRYLFLLLLATACVPLGTPITDPNAARSPGQQRPPEYYADKTLRYQDFIYNPDVKSVQCYVATGQPTEVFQPPVAPLQGQGFTLEFDLLGSKSERLTAKLVHCDVDWKPSVLTDMQFLNEINEFLLTDYRTGVGTKVPYYHYRLRVPPVKISGNYLLVVQSSGRVPLLTRRLMVYQNDVEVDLRQGIPVAGEERYTLQQVDFAIRYGAMNLINPAQEVKVILRQNFRWDNAKINLRPTFVRDAERLLQYQYFNFENTFPGLSEFRFFDTRSLRVLGQGMAKLDPEATPRAVLLTLEGSRNGQAYTQYEDINGQRVFENREFGNGDSNADYANVTFQLKAEQPAAGPVYIIGALTDWQFKDEFKLTYDAENQIYSTTALLKQGYYNYYFATQTPQGPNSVPWEGSHQETENQYDLLVYYRPPGTRSDLLIGYQAITVNGRRP